MASLAYDCGAAGAIPVLGVVFLPTAGVYAYQASKAKSTS